MNNQPTVPDEQLNRIVLQGVPPEAADDLTSMEAISLENARLEITNKRQDIKLRKGFGIAIFVLACIWLLFIGFAILVHVFTGICCRSLSLAQAAILALAATTP